MNGHQCAQMLTFYLYYQELFSERDHELMLIMSLNWMKALNIKHNNQLCRINRSQKHFQTKHKFQRNLYAMEIAQNDIENQQA